MSGRTRHAPRVGLVSLGCAKALVDSERIATALRRLGYDFAPDYAGADAVIVNTCGFLDSARAESLAAISEALVENGKVIVTGCMGADEAAMRDVASKVLAITGPARVEEVVAAVKRAVPPPAPAMDSPVMDSWHDPKIDLTPAGVKFTPPHYAYLKISEGCSNKCTFCIIPRLRGPLVSRPAVEVLGEAEALAARGVKELLVISQDTPAYGRDLRYAESAWRGKRVRARVTELARALGEMFPWVRLHYLYPYPIVDELVELMAQGLVLPYLDVPFQHAAPNVLRHMRRPADEEKALRRIDHWRQTCPDVAIRSTFIVGFPGETEEDFRYLLDWLRAARIDRVGCFVYEPVDGAAANALPHHVPREVAEERKRQLMLLQEEISAENLKRKVGREITVLVDEIDEEQGLVVARSPWDAPEVDGMVLIPHASAPQAAPGEFMQVRVTGSDVHDLLAEPLTGRDGTRTTGERDEET